MDCPKCKGLMVAEQPEDFFLRSLGHMWKCVNCGCMADPIILQNQRRPPALHREVRPRHSRAVKQSMEFFPEEAWD